MPAVVVDVVVVDGHVVGVVVRVKSVADVVVHLVVAPVPALVSVGVVAKVEVVDVRVEDVARNRNRVEKLRVGEVLTEAANLVGEAVALRLVVPEICFVNGCTLYKANPVTLVRTA